MKKEAKKAESSSNNNGNITVDIDTDGITNAMQDLLLYKNQKYGDFQKFSLIIFSHNNNYI